MANQRNLQMEPSLLDVHPTSAGSADRAGWRSAQSDGGRLRPADDLPATLPEMLRRAAASAPARELVYVQGDGSDLRQTYRTLLAEAERILAGLRAAGLRAGDQTILQFERNEDLLPAFWGCVLGGIRPLVAPVPPTFSHANRLLDQLVHLCGVLDHPTAITTSGLRNPLASLADSLPAGGLSVADLDELREHPADHDYWPCSADDPAFFSLTSGSTNLPKCVVLTHRNVLARASGANQLGRHSADDIALNWLPFDHIGSISDWHLRCVLLACQAVYAPTRYVLAQPLRWLDLLEEHEVTHSWAPNFAYQLVNELLAKAKSHPWDLTRVVGLLTAGEAVSAQVLQRFAEALAPCGLRPTVLRPAFGMAEMASGVTYHLGDEEVPIQVRRVKRSSLLGDLQSATQGDPDAVEFVSLGPPIPGVRLRIVDADGNLCPEERVGQLQVQGDPVSRGYFGAPESQDAFHKDGWFETGDQGFLSRGELYLTGRAKETIIVNGVHYGCSEIEELVSAEKGVEPSYSAACAVRKGAMEQEQLAVFFHTAETSPRELAALRKRIRGNLARRLGIKPDYLLPVPKESIPKTAIGKLQRGPLRRRFEAGEFDEFLKQFELVDRTEEPPPSSLHGPTGAPDNSVTRQLLEIWKDVLNLPQVGLGDNVFELGGNSVLLVRLHSRIEAAFGPRLSLVDMFQYPTIEALSRLLAAPPDANAVPSPAVRGRQRAEARRRSQSADGTSDIAVVGLACRFPGAVDAVQFWQRLVAGEESISFFSERQVLAAGVDPALVRSPQYVRAAPVLDGIEQFDADFFGYSAREAERMDPQQRVLLECAWETMEDAGYDLRGYPGAVGVFVSGVLNTYLLNNLYPRGAHLEQDASRVLTLSSSGGFQVMIANDKDYLPTRISYKLNLRGPSLNVQTACSSSLVAIHLAAQSLRDGECEMALAGGVSISVPQETGYLYQEGLLVSPDGHCRPFDAQAQGTVFGNGAGLVLLKRLDKALADGDRIYAVIKGSAVNNDGGQKAGYLAPSQDGQAAVVAEALAAAGVNAESISYVEAHGTGTVLGDPIEIAGLTQAFRADTVRRQFCAVGSVKSNVGHLQIASGVAGFIKTVLALYHRQLVPSLHFQVPNPRIDFAHSPFYVNTELRDWSQGDGPRRASVNSLGIGGTNVHVILEESPEVPRPVPAVDRPAHLLVLSGKTREAVSDLAKRWAAFAETRGEADLGDACFTANAGRAHFLERLAVAADGWPQLGEALKRFLAGQAPSDEVVIGSARDVPPQLAFVFSGEGSEYVDMGRELYEGSPTFRSWIDRCQEILRPLLSETLVDRLYSDSARARRRGVTLWAQPALFAVEYALARLWMSWGIAPSLVVGQRVGQYVAACLAGVLSLDDALELVVHRARVMQDSPGADQRVAREFREAASRVAYSRPRIPTVSLLGGSTTPDEIAGADYWCQHLREPTEFPAGVPALADCGCDVFLEIGPEATRLTAARGSWGESRLAGSRDWLPSLRRGRPAWETMLNSLAALYVRGAAVDWAGFDRDYVRRRTSVPAYPFQRRRYWVERPGDVQASVGHGRRAQQETHPLLGRRVISPALKEAVFESELSLDSLPLLNDHRFCEIPLLPGAFQLAMFAEAASRLGIPAGCAIEGVSFTKALASPPDTQRTVQVIISDSGGPNQAAQLVSRTSDVAEGNCWIVHSTGSITSPVAEATGLPVEVRQGHERLLARAVRVVPRDEFYAAMREHWADLRASFQAVETAWVSHDEVLCRIRIPQGLERSARCLVHAVLLDACVQALGGIEPYPAQHTLLPTAVERFRFLESPRAEYWWCYLRRAPRDAASAGQQTADAWLFEPDGRVIATFAGLRLDEIPREVLIEALGAEEIDWIYRPVWVPAVRPPADARRTPEGAWLVFADRGGVGRRLAALLEDRGARCAVVWPGDRLHCDGPGSWRLDPGDPEHFRQLLAAPPAVSAAGYRGVVHLWGLDQPADSLWLVDPRCGCASALYLLQALGKANLTNSLKFCLVTRGAQAVDERAGPLNVWQAPLWGLGRAVSLEYAEIESLRVDLDPDLGDGQAELLLEELWQRGPESEIALRGTDRYTLRLDRQTMDRAVPLRVRSDATYLITGGTGGIGLQLAGWLVEQGARHLALVSRRGASSPEARRAAERWVERGIEVVIHGADVAVEDELSAVLTHIRSRMAPLGGVFHAAGILADGMLQDLGWDSFERVLGAKAIGAWNLHCLTEDQSLDFFVVCSSIASVLGSPGQANYAASNAFLDMLMHHRRALGLPGLAVNWGPWRDVGMAATLDAAGQRALARRGLMPLEAAEALRALPALIQGGAAQFVAARIDWRLYRQEMGDAVAPWVERLVHGDADRSAGQGGIKTFLEQATGQDRHRLLLDHVRDLIAGLLGLPSGTSVDLERGFTDLGLDSLGVLTLRNRLQTNLGITLPATVAFKFSTVQALVEYLAETLGLTQSPPVGPQVVEAQEVDAASELDQLSLPDLADRLAAKLAAIRSEYGKA